jgi:hypothetical protein
MAFKQIPVEQIDLILKLTEPQLKTWLYHFRNERGKEGKSYLNQDTVAEATNLSRSAISHAREWLTENGWLKVVGYRTSVHGGNPVREYQCLFPSEQQAGENTIGTQKPIEGGAIGTGKPKQQAPRNLSNRHRGAAEVYTNLEVDTIEVDKNQQQLVSKLVSSDDSLRSSSPDPVSLRSTDVSGNSNSNSNLSVVHENEDLKWYREYISNEPGNQRYYNISLPLAESMGAPGITDQEIPNLNVIVKWADLRAWEDEYPTELYRWSQKHPFLEKTNSKFRFFGQGYVQPNRKGDSGSIQPIPPIPERESGVKG